MQIEQLKDFYFKKEIEDKFEEINFQMKVYQRLNELLKTLKGKTFFKL